MDNSFINNMAIQISTDCFTKCVNFANQSVLSKQERECADNCASKSYESVNQMIQIYSKNIN